MDYKDRDRLLYSTGIIASFFAYISVRSQIISWLTPTSEKYVFWAIAISASLSAFYLLISASAMKYQQHYMLGVVKTSKKQAGLLYDMSVDVFMFSAVFFLTGVLINLVSSRTSLELIPFVSVILFMATILLFRYGWPIIFRIFEFSFRPADKGTTLYDKEILISMLIGVGLILLLENINIIARLILGTIFVIFIIISIVRQRK